MIEKILIEELGRATLVVVMILIWLAVVVNGKEVTKEVLEE